MGCFESKLLQIGPVQNQYQQNPIQQNQLYHPQYKYQQQHSQQQQLFKNKTNKTTMQYRQNLSEYQLHLNLGNTIQNFQQKFGKITYRCIIDPEFKTIRSSKKIKQQNNNNNKIVRYRQQQQQQQRSYNYQFTSSQSQRSNITKYSSNNRQQQQRGMGWLKSITLQSIQNFQKQIFFSEYSSINSYRLYKWNQKLRIPLQFNTFQQCIGSIKYCKYDRTVNYLLVIYMINISNQIRLVSYTLEQRYEEKQYVPLGVKIYLNGCKRLFPITSQSSQLQTLIKNKNVKSMSSRLIIQLGNILQPQNKINKIDPCFFIYHITGWIPQIIQLQKISLNFQLMEKLFHNLDAFNAIIIFLNAKNQQNLFVVTQINLMKSTITYLSTAVAKQSKSIEKATKTVEWLKLIKKCSKLSINWNPSFYQSSAKIESQYKFTEDYPLILLTIPPSNKQLEVRIFIEQHMSVYEDSMKQYILELYQYVGQRSIALKSQPIKTINSGNSRFLTQIFIFEQSKVPNKYIFLLRPNFVYENNENNENNKYEQNLQFSTCIYSFKDISVQKLSPSSKSVQSNLQTQITSKNNGYALNSPNFYENPQYYIQIPRCQLTRISILLTQKQQSNDNSFTYQILMVPNRNRVTNTKLLKINDLVSSEYISDILFKDGFMQFQTYDTSYILFLICYSIPASKSFLSSINTVPITIKIQCQDIEQYSNQKCGNQLIKIEKINPLQLQQNGKQIKQIKQIRQFQWKSNNYGPRKRTLKNTTNQYYPIQTFKSFFSNPYFDEYLEAGTYQFNIRSKSYKSQYQMMALNLSLDKTITQLQSIQIMEKMVPPSLSLGICKKYQEQQKQKQNNIINNCNTNKYKIILDDQYYVPFGFGYWSKYITLTAGMYRLVMPKLQKDVEDGQLVIIKRVQNSAKNN